MALDSLARRLPGLVAAGFRAKRLGEQARAEEARRAEQDQAAAQRAALERLLLSRQVDEAGYRAQQRPILERRTQEQHEAAIAAQRALAEQRMQPPRQSPSPYEAERGRLQARRDMGVPLYRPSPTPNDPDAPPPRRRWVATEAQRLMRDRDPLTGLARFKSFAEAQAEAEGRYDQLFADEAPADLGPPTGGDAAMDTQAGGQRAMARFGARAPATMPEGDDPDMTPADYWESLVNAGVSKAEATALTRAKYGT